MKLNEIYDASVLPISYSNGSSIVCTTIAGGRRFTKKMPDDLLLVRTLSDGTEITAEYILRVSSISDQHPELNKTIEKKTRHCGWHDNPPQLENLYADTPPQGEKEE